MSKLRFTQSLFKFYQLYMHSFAFLSVECVCIVLMQFYFRVTTGPSSYVLPHACLRHDYGFSARLSPTCFLYLIRNWTRSVHQLDATAPRACYTGTYYYHAVYMLSYWIDICLFCSLPLDFRRKSEPHINFLPIMLVTQGLIKERVFGMNAAESFSPVGLMGFQVM